MHIHNFRLLNAICPIMLYSGKIISFMPKHRIEDCLSLNHSVISKRRFSRSFSSFICCLHQ